MRAQNLCARTFPPRLLKKGAAYQRKVEMSPFCGSGLPLFREEKLVAEAVGLWARGARVWAGGGQRAAERPVDGHAAERVVHGLSTRPEGRAPVRRARPQIHSVSAGARSFIRSPRHGDPLAAGIVRPVFLDQHSCLAPFSPRPRRSRTRGRARDTLIFAWRCPSGLRSIFPRQFRVTGSLDNATQQAARVSCLVAEARIATPAPSLRLLHSAGGPASGDACCLACPTNNFVKKRC